MHALLPPSGAGAWVECGAWVLMNQTYPQADTPASAEGTAAHWAASEMLAERVVAEGQVAPNGIVLTEEVIEGAELYYDAVIDAVPANITAADKLYVEKRVDIPGIHALNWGTPDAWFYDPVAGVLHVFDFKFGHDFVSEFENWQLIDYVAGILDQLDIDGHADQHLTVRMTVVQPRSYHRAGPVRTWTVKAWELRPYFNKLRMAAEIATAPNAPAVPNAQCLYCPGRHACEALQRDAYRSARLSVASLPVDLPPDALGLELRYLREASKRLDGRITGLQEQARATLAAGQHVAFHALENVEGRRAWNKTVDEVVQLGQLFGVDVAKRGAITPAQAITAGLSADVVAQYSERPSGLKLVPDDGSTARRVFSK
jgi:hypothetical protein